MKEYRILVVREPGVILAETGYYDDHKKWVATSSRPATEAECNPFANQGIISMKQEIEDCLFE